jgi:hypothetical protein
MMRRLTGVQMVSLIFLGIDIIALIASALYVSQFQELFSVLGRPVPALTGFVLSSRYFSIGAALVLVVKEFSPNKIVTFLVNAAVLALLAFIGLPILVVGLFAPVFQ